MLRAMLYDRHSCGDVELHGQRLERLRQHARLRGWRIVGEPEDAAELNTTRWPGWLEVKAAVDRGEVDVVAVTELRRCCRGADDLCRLLGDWLYRQPPVHLVAVEDEVDTTAPEQLAILRPTAGVFLRLAKTAHTESIRRGLHRRAVRRAVCRAKGYGDAAHRKAPRPVVNALEVKALWQDQALSYRKTLARLKAAGIKISYGTLYGLIQQWIGDGVLSPEERKATRASNREERKER